MKSQLIEEIVAQRQQQVPQLDHLKQSVMKIQSLLQVSLSEYQKIKNLPEVELVREIPNLRTQLSSLIKKIDALKERFKKDNICIGVAGRARSGKSTMLQTLTSLANEVIPSSDGTQTTGAKSKISHYLGQPYAEVEFLSEQEIMQGLLKGYYEDLGIIDYFPEYLDALLASPCYPNEDQLDHTQRALLVTLKNQVEKIREVREHFENEKNKKLRIDHLSDIKEYVSQEDGRKNYIAVKNVEIFTKFPSEQNLNKLSVIDLPGLGEVAKGHEEKLLHSIKGEVDALIILKKPNHMGDIWERNEIAVFEMIQKVLPDVNLKYWLFPVLNAFDQKSINAVTGESMSISNLKVIEGLLKEKHMLPKDLQILQCDVKNKEDVYDLFLNKILSYVKANLTLIDELHLNQLRNEVLHIKKNLMQLLETQSNTSNGLNALDTENEFNDRLFPNTWKFLRNRFTNQIERLEDFVYQEKTHPNLLSIKSRNEKGEVFNIEKKLFNDFLNSIEKELIDAHHIPDAKTLNEERKNRDGSMADLFSDKKRDLRTNLSRSLSQKIDQVLKDSFEEEFDIIFEDVFPDSIKKLIALADPEKEALSWKDKFRKFRDMFLTNRKEYSILYEAVTFLLESKFDYYTLFHYHAREQMEPLNHSSKLEHFDKENMEDFRNHLISIYQEVLFNIIRSLSSENFRPKLAIFALIEEFRDRIILLTNPRNVEDDWRLLLRENRIHLWGELSDQADKSHAIQQWDASLTQLRSIVSSFSFLDQST